MLCEGVCHLIGWYPDWWPGRRFKEPIVGWAAGEDVKAVRESLQPTFLGPAEDRGTGLIPAASLVRHPARGGVPDAVDFIEVKYKDSNSETSRLVIKSYDQGRESFQASGIKLMIFDEEPPLAIYPPASTVSSRHDSQHVFERQSRRSRRQLAWKIAWYAGSACPSAVRQSLVSLLACLPTPARHSGDG